MEAQAVHQGLLLFGQGNGTVGAWRPAFLLLRVQCARAGRQNRMTGNTVQTEERGNICTCPPRGQYRKGPGRSGWILLQPVHLATPPTSHKSRLQNGQLQTLAWGPDPAPIKINPQANQTYRSAGDPPLSTTDHSEILWPPAASGFRRASGLCAQISRQMRQCLGEISGARGSSRAERYAPFAPG